MLQIGAVFILLQIRASTVTNWGSYYKLGQSLLQSRAAITNWGKMYYQLKQVLQIRAIITNWWHNKQPGVQRTDCQYFLFRSNLVFSPALFSRPKNDPKFMKSIKSFISF